MNPFCGICKRSFANNFNLNRHLESYHSETAEEGDDVEEEEEEISDTESENGNETRDTKSENGSETRDTDEESENSHASEDRDVFTYDDVQAIVRFTLKANNR